MATVERPMVSSAATSVVLRPTRSPKWPKSAEPTGRAKKRNRKRRERGERGGGRIGRGEKQFGEDQHRRGRVDIEVEKLDGRADQAGKQHLRGLIESRACARIVLTCREADVGSFTQWSHSLHHNPRLETLSGSSPTVSLFRCVQTRRHSDKVSDRSPIPILLEPWDVSCVDTRLRQGQTH